MAPPYQRPVRPDGLLTVDDLAAICGTTTRRIRSLQTLGLLPHPALEGRTGLYGPQHRHRLAAILRLQDQGFSLESLGVLFGVLAERRTLADVLGDGAGETLTDRETDDDELYGFADLQRPHLSPHARRDRPLLSLVPTTVWNESEAS